MYKRRIAALLLLLLLGTMPTVQARGAGAPEFPGRVLPTYVISNLNPGEAYKVLDNNPASAWVAERTEDLGALTFRMDNAGIKTVWLRGGNYASLNEYKAAGRPRSVELRLLLADGSSESRLFSLYDIYDLQSDMPYFKQGYQALDLGRQYTGVQQADIQFLDLFPGDSNTHFAVSDVVFTDGSGAQSYYADGTQEAQAAVPEGQPTPTMAAAPTLPAEPAVQAAGSPQAVQQAPQPAIVPAASSAGQGLRAVLKERLASRSGPGTQYDGTGVYEYKGEEVLVLSRGWDKRNRIWWVQVDIDYGNQRRRIYTGIKRFDLDPELLPEESVLHGYAVAVEQAMCFYGPGPQYAARKVELEPGTEGCIYAIENGYAHFEYEREPKKLRRVWVKQEKLRIP